MAHLFLSNFLFGGFPSFFFVVTVSTTLTILYNCSLSLVRVVFVIQCPEGIQQIPCLRTTSLFQFLSFWNLEEASSAPSLWFSFLWGHISCKTETETGHVLNSLVHIGLVLHGFPSNNRKDCVSMDSLQIERKMICSWLNSAPLSARTSIFRAFYLEICKTPPLESEPF